MSIFDITYSLASFEKLFAKPVRLVNMPLRLLMWVTFVFLSSKFWQQKVGLVIC